ncbi:HEAT repeat domain-containing protein [Sphingobacterium hungaricum]
MERDHFKEFIKENKASFEDGHVPSFSFDAVKEKMEQRKKAKVRKLNNRYFAVAAMLFLIGIFAWIFMQNNQPMGELDHAKTFVAEMAPSQYNNVSPEVDQPVANAYHHALAVEHAKSNQSKRSTETDYLLASLHNESSSERLNGVLKIGERSDLNNRLINGLCEQLAHDENGNVRLAALEILSSYADRTNVQSAIKNALLDQRDPIVQMEIIRMTESLNNPNINAILYSLVEDQETARPVQEAAYLALAQNASYQL